MNPPDPREVMDLAHRRLLQASRLLEMLPSDALGIASEDMAHHYVRDRHASALHGLICDLEEKLKKEDAA